MEQQQRAEQTKIANANADRAAARQKRWNEFAQNNRIEMLVSAQELKANPYIFQGKTVAVYTVFTRMLSADMAKFGVDGIGRDFVASGVPASLFRKFQQEVVVAGRVLGLIDLKNPQILEQAKQPNLKFVGVHFCQDQYCGDLIALR